MAKRFGKDKKETPFRAKRLIAYVLVFLVIIAIIFLPNFSKLQKLRDENERLQKRIFLLEEHNAKLQDEQTKMMEDPEYIERKAREKLGIVKKGEIIYRPSKK